jgi:protein-disulfide isomerase
MSSRVAQRQQARARRIAEEQARAEQERRKRRLWTLAGVMCGAVVVVAVAIAVSSGGGGGGLQSGAKASGTVATVDQLLSGVPQSGTRLGSPNAPVTMYYYGDLECPICQAFTLSSFAQLVGADVRAGRVKVIYRALETATRDPQTFQTQQVAALAAGAQNRFWNFAELFYHEQGTEDSGYVTETYLDGLARQVPGLNFAQWQSARGSQMLTAQIGADAQDAAATHAQGTPTLVFKGPRGQVQAASAVPSYSELAQAINSVK